MAGIYIHIPFCKQACHYCNFHFSTSLHYKNDLVDALLRETQLQKEYLGGEEIHTVYFGGGTPSLLTETDLEKIMDSIHKNFPISAEAEISLEANPDDISKKMLQSWKKLGINRLSIGVQSFFEEDLVWMNRAHYASQSIESIHSAQEEGFSNISIDLIYGTPTLSHEKWEKNMNMAVSLDIPHLSCYALTVEPKTPLYKMINQNKAENIDPDLQATQFLQLMDYLDQKGYEHYEISNFAKPGKRSKHNSSYWKGEKYLGLGPSAHSFNGDSRQWNIANNNQYIDSLKQHQLKFEKETLTEKQKLNEYIMISLRTKEGCDLDRVEKIFGEIYKTSILKNAHIYINESKLVLKETCLLLNNEGKLLADGIAADLFLD